jgi:hypothetical protein
MKLDLFNAGEVADTGRISLLLTFAWPLGPATRERCGLAAELLRLRRRACAARCNPARFEFFGTLTRGRVELSLL